MILNFEFLRSHQRVKVQLTEFILIDEGLEPDTESVEKSVLLVQNER
jgi:hypothetical protein